ncbi:MAG TPA: hemagglutinin repeat-containing protein [Arsenophonus sp.]
MQTQGQLTLVAGQDLLARAVNVVIGGQLSINVGRNINITAGVDNRDYAKHSKHTDKGLLSNTTKERHDEQSERTTISGTFSGDSVNVTAANDINITGSNLLSTNDLSVVAGN